MKVLAFNGSARKDGNTALLLKRVLAVLREEGFETELIQIAGQKIQGCNACRACIEAKNQRCVVVDDKVNEYIGKMQDADALIFGSPTYFSTLTPELLALMDRAFYVARANGDMFKRKVGAAVVAVRRAGAMPAFDAINRFFLISQMIVPGSNYWNVGVGRLLGEVEKDEEAMKTMDTLGKNVAWLLKKLKA